jgi:hypothetical protein
MEKETIEVLCQVAKKISQARVFVDRETKIILNDALELMAAHCDCSVDRLIRNMSAEIFNNIEYEQKKLK